MRIFYDTEFLELGPDHPIYLISIGMLAEDGRELYLINGEAPLNLISNHQWLMDNVVPSLPIVVNTDPSIAVWAGTLEWMDDDPVYDENVFNRMIISEKLTEFIDDTPSPELWGYCSAYDHVILAQCFGTMPTMHSKLRYYTNDLAQLALTWGIDHHDMPRNTGTAHRAIDDARWTAECYDYLVKQHRYDLVISGDLRRD